MKKNFFEQLFLTFLILVPTTSALGYDTDELEMYQQKYPGKMAVVLNHNQIVSIEINSKTGGFEVYETDYEEVLYLTESSKFYTSQSIYTSDFFEDLVDVNVRVYNKKGKVAKLKTEDFKLVDSPPSSWVFHDDDKELVFEFDELGEGFRTIIEYKKRIKRPEFFDVFHFMSVHPVEQTRLEITYPTTVKLNYFEQNLEGYTVSKKQESIKKKIRDTWVLHELEAYKEEDGATDVKYHIPHVLAQIVSYPENGREKRLIGSAEELHGFFQEFLLLKEQEVSKHSKDDFDNVWRIAAKLTDGMEDPLDKMDTIYGWVQENIKYIAFEDGINGYVPRPCNVVMKNRYGDCKDMGNLLVEMLTYVGVENTYVAWVGTREIPYQMSEIPSPLTCNHVICVVRKPAGDGYYYLDATHDQGGYKLPPYNIQGKELLIHLGTDEFELFKVPEVSADVNYLRSHIRYKLDEDDSLRGTGVDYYGGFERENRTYYLENLDDEDLFDYVKEMVLGGFNRYRLMDYSINNLQKNNEELRINYDFAVDNLFIRHEDDWIINPTLFKPRVTQYNLEDHSRSRHKKYHRTVDYTFEFEIPADFKVIHLPENTAYNHDLFNFQSVFQLEGGVVSVQMKYQYHLLEISPKLYPEWNAFSKAINNATIQNIILHKIAS